MKAALLPGSQVGLHFGRAAAWLERFHAAEPTAVRGDFWARNIVF